MKTELTRPKHVYTAKGERGVFLNFTDRPCHEGCTGMRVSVRWPDGKITYPCSKGMRTRPDGDWEIA